jgi:hypothetical protein
LKAEVWLAGELEELDKMLDEMWKLAEKFHVHMILLGEHLSLSNRPTPFEGMPRRDLSEVMSGQ